MVVRICKMKCRYQNCQVETWKIRLLGKRGKGTKSSTSRYPGRIQDQATSCNCWTWRRGRGVGGGDPTAPSGRAGSSSSTLVRDRLRLLRGARGPGGNQPDLAQLHGSVPWLPLRASGSFGPRPTADGPPRLTLSAGPALQAAARANRQGGRALPGRRLPGRVPSPYSRWLSGGCHSAVTCPGPRQGSADQLITR